ncbi:hypothetical protein Nepgr_023536 [Nepenthes gracilis]|uniref:SET domain-containing protein n=1 Tax=Nepenthes gracilis TaxID=150966 RepID=A0AAD3T393_NEPGR|nr:hypothetical protein Nepgr_023536 [Nepenthes gracilis]
METQKETKFEQFLQWLQFNRVELRGCEIRYCDSSKGFGLFSASHASDGVLLVVPLDLAITPMRVLQDHTLGPECRVMFDEGDVDDRFLMILYLTVERLRKNSSWKPYLNMIPSTFRNPLWFTDDEMQELRGTTLYRATELQKKNLQSIFEDKVKDLVTRVLVLDGNSESEVTFEDFLWANSVFWTRALNIPLPRSYVFPEIQEADGCFSNLALNSEDSCSSTSCTDVVDSKDEKSSELLRDDGGANGVILNSTHGETLWVEGLVPGIDFCNHDLKAAATWEVDGTGSVTGVPLSMYLLSANQDSSRLEKEITISYGNKGNEELLYLYGFVIEDNPDDYLMVHYPVEALQNVSFSESKSQLLDAQKAEYRCLLPRSLLDHGFFPECCSGNISKDKPIIDRVCNYSWSGERKTPSYKNKLVFPEDFLTSLRTISMQEDELFKVSSLLAELVECEEERQPSDVEVRAAVWEACGDSGALQLLVDLLNKKMMDLEAGSGTEDSDSELLENANVIDVPAGNGRVETTGSNEHKLMGKNSYARVKKTAELCVQATETIRLDRVARSRWP